MNRFKLHFRIAFFSCALSSCTVTEPTNSAFDITRIDAREAIAAMEQNPVSLERPLVVLGGHRDPGLAASTLKRRFSRITADPRIIAVSFRGLTDFDEGADQVIRSVDEHFPTSSRSETIEVDVVAMSMGGLVARYAALPQSETRRLRINRLFTISTPHQGADLASLPSRSEVQIQMRHESELIRRLTESAPDYVIIPYVRSGDRIVGGRNAAPHSEDPWWVPTFCCELKHHLAFADTRIIADIGARLQGRAPYTTLPRAPLP